MGEAAGQGNAIQAGWRRLPQAFSLAGLPRALLSHLRSTLAAERDAGRWFLWIPVEFAAGILVYFTLPAEPSVFGLAGLTFAALALLRVSRQRPAVAQTLTLVIAVAAGALTAKVRTELVSAPVLAREITTTITGWVAGAEETPTGGRRLRIRVASMADVPLAAQPRIARVTVRSAKTEIAVGDAISVLASVGPPSGPLMPGGYDFAFPLYFQGIGATGFAFGGVKSAPDVGPPPWSIRVAMPIAAVRDALRLRIEAALPGNDGHIAAALVMGDQRGIAEDTQDDMRASGLGHIFSISGLHLALVAGAVFWLVRALLALSPALALRHPIKKWAAGSALVVATIYTAISGAEVATVRSWVMLAIMLGAILADRRALTLRNVALAALVILVFTPESLLSISFQMSFAATIALISAFEAISRWQATRLVSAEARGRTLFRRGWEATTLLFATSLVAGLATAPFGIFYFQRVAPLTIIANMAVAPAISFIVMPMALLAVVVMPLGLEGYPLQAMQWGLQWMLFVAEKTAGWSEGLGAVPSMPAVALLLMTAGFLWLAVWQQAWRLLGVLPIIAAIPLTVFAPRPVIVVDEDAKAAAVRSDSGRFSILGGKGASFAFENWLRADGDTRPPELSGLTKGVTCDGLGCVARTGDGSIVALSTWREGLAEDCAVADVVISRFDAPPGCSGYAMVIDRAQLDAHGAHAVFLENGNFRVTFAYPAERRPFMPPVRD